MLCVVVTEISTSNRMLWMALDIAERYREVVEECVMIRADADDIRLLVWASVIAAKGL